MEIKANGGEAIKNDILYGSVKGLKIDRETEKPIVGAKFGLFRSGETEFTAEKAILTAESGKDGVFVFEKIPYGNWLIKELQPANGYLPNEEIYPVTVSKNEQVIGVTVVNDRIPEIGTQATVDGEKGDLRHRGVHADRYRLLQAPDPRQGISPCGNADGQKHRKSLHRKRKCGNSRNRLHARNSERNGYGILYLRFKAHQGKHKPCGFLKRCIRTAKELAVHADINDNGQTVKVKVPEIGTKATVNGKKEVTASGRVKIEDTVSYKNLTPGKEYTVKGVLMNKATGNRCLRTARKFAASSPSNPTSRTARSISPSYSTLPGLKLLPRSWYSKPSTFLLPSARADEPHDL